MRRLALLQVLTREHSTLHLDCTVAERAIQTFKSGMKKLTIGSLETRVARFLFTYRITPQTTTGSSPSELLLSCHLDFYAPA